VISLGAYDNLIHRSPERCGDALALSALQKAGQGYGSRASEFVLLNPENNKVALTSSKLTRYIQVHFAKRKGCDSPMVSFDISIEFAPGGPRFSSRVFVFFFYFGARFACKVAFLVLNEFGGDRWFRVATHRPFSSHFVNSTSFTSCSTRTSATDTFTTFNPCATPATHSLRE